MGQSREVTWSIPDHYVWIPNMLAIALAHPLNGNKIDNTGLSPF